VFFTQLLLNGRVRGPKIKIQATCDFGGDVQEAGGSCTGRGMSSSSGTQTDTAF